MSLMAQNRGHSVRDTKPRVLSLWKQDHPEMETAVPNWDLVPLPNYLLEYTVKKYSNNDMFP